MEIILRKATLPEAEEVYLLTAKRVSWMSDNNIHQWNDTDYLNVYPLTYYQYHINQLYVLSDPNSSRVVCAGVLLRQDIRWEDNAPAIYIHNLVSDISYPGAGKAFISNVEQLASRNEIHLLRLDSAEDNLKLSLYYESLGFKACGFCTDGNYKGILRQKSI